MKIKKILILSIFMCLLLCGCEKLSCPDGYTLIKDKQQCYKRLIKNADVEYECNIGDTLDGSMCITKKYSVAHFIYECPIGYYVVGGQCWKIGGVLNLQKCGANHVYLNGYCYTNILATMKYTCIVGRLEGTRCVTENTYFATEKYFCDEDFELKINKCYKDEYVQVLKNKNRFF